MDMIGSMGLQRRQVDSEKGTGEGRDAANSAAPPKLAHNLEPAFFEGLLRTVPGYVVKTSVEGHFLFVSQRGQAGPMEPVAGRKVEDFVDEAARPRVRRCLADVVRTGVPGSFECDVFGASVGDARFHVFVGPVIEGNQVTSLVLVAQDATQLKRMAEHQRQTQKMEAVGQLAAGVAHNFNNTLQGIVGNIELARSQVDGGVRSNLDNALAACGDASRLVKDLLMFAGKQVRPGRELLKLEACIERVVSMCRVTFDRLIELRVERLASIPPLPLQIHEVEHAVFNLLLNARDAVALTKRPQITLQLNLLPANAPELAAAPHPPQPVDHAVIRVRDNGCGMAEEVANRVFEPFFTTKPVGQGTGLGLATVLACAREHEGWARCESTPGEGSTITLYFPIPSGRARPTPPPSPPPAPPRGPVVLVVDDEEIVRESVARVLRFGGFQAFTAADGKAALAFVAAGAPQPELVLLDESMPGLDGSGVRRRLAEVAPELKVVILSGLGAADVDRHGAVAVLEKPVRAEALLDAVRQVLGVADLPP